ncbi:MAG: hypothetical protein H6510_01650 [Acidobacteria bacterium]|nr:hypothetical protein [Acidobacteriota bacterium]
MMVDLVFCLFLVCPSGGAGGSWRSVVLAADQLAAQSTRSGCFYFRKENQFFNWRADQTKPVDVPVSPYWLYRQSGDHLVAFHYRDPDPIRVADPAGKTWSIACPKGGPTLAADWAETCLYHLNQQGQRLTFRRLDELGNTLAETAFDLGRDLEIDLAYSFFLDGLWHVWCPRICRIWVLDPDLQVVSSIRVKLPQSILEFDPSVMDPFFEWPGEQLESYCQKMHGALMAVFTGNFFKEDNHYVLLYQLGRLNGCMKGVTIDLGFQTHAFFVDVAGEIDAETVFPDSVYFRFGTGQDLVGFYDEGQPPPNHHRVHQLHRWSGLK